MTFTLEEQQFIRAMARKEIALNMERIKKFKLEGKGCEIRADILSMKKHRDLLTGEAEIEVQKQINSTSVILSGVMLEIKICEEMLIKIEEHVV